MLTLFVLWMGLQAHAEDSEFESTRKEQPHAASERATTVIAELGGSHATGKVVFYTVNGGVVASHRWKMNKLSGAMGIQVGKAVADANGDGHLDAAERRIGLVENSRRYEAESRYDRFVGKRDSLYVLVGGFVDPFAGYDLRTHEQVGYSRQLVKNDETSWVVEFGVDYAQENYVDGVVPNSAHIVAARLMTAFTHQFSEGVAIGDTLEIYENVVTPEDLRLLNTGFVSSKISDKLSLKISHTLTFDNVPVEGFQPLDQVSMLTLVATLL